MPRPSVVVLLAVILAPPGALLGQSRVSQLVDSARVQLAANHLDSAEALLRAALDSTAQAAPATATTHSCGTGSCNSSAATRTSPAQRSVRRWPSTQA